ncbi:MAG: SDR family NAD(P)-dependent oxidoreductase [Myxococcota bacterium]
MATFGAASTAEEVTEGIDLRGTTWLVTGVNSGLGEETARVLGLRGAHVIGAARTEEKAAAALQRLGIEGTPVACELSDLESVRACVAAVEALGRPLRGIIANAGIMALPTLQQRDGVELQLYTNHVGHFVLVTGLLDRLEPNGRVVMLSSGAHFRAREQGLELDNLLGERDYEAWRMYGRSKLANILFARSLARRFAADGSGRTANAVHPGVIETNLARHVADAETLFASMRDRMKTVAQGAATQCYVATRPELAEVSGRYFSDCDVAEALPQASDDALADELWARTEEIVARA